MLGSFVLSLPVSLSWSKHPPSGSLLFVKDEPECVQIVDC